ncbi:hypothetical protein JAAARDRAFT_29764 [Jaapia argillacea MUCL 33604]|uniref:Ras GEF n=1 Tax=Jaapia argillacea MUCL 33604 TaxID=933084 RepID=A0A067QJN2_9AGAM|nr:hypothetical protein JAAARDRAFT_29764 [Jaapia argillacea MUCL 33604]
MAADTPRPKHSPSLEFLSTGSRRRITDADSASKVSLRLNPSSASFASQETFMTAMSSIPIESGIPDGSPTHSLAPPASLRKSVSVDSFMDYQRDHTSTLFQRHPKFDLAFDFEEPEASSSFAVGLSEGLASADGDVQLSPSGSTVGLASRSRAASVSTVPDAESPLDDSDVELSETLGRRIDSPRRTPSKGRSRRESLTRPGDLSLPPRLPPLGSTASLSSISITGSEKSAFGRSSTSHLPPRRSTYSAPVFEAPGRTRSGSLGVNPSHSTKLRPINTHVSIPNYPWPEVSIAIAGTPGCGKSTLIKKGLKPYGLSEPTPCSVPVGRTGAFNYTFRVGKLPQDHQSSDRFLGVMELDVPPDSLESVPSASGVSSSSGGPVWPGGAPNIEGVIVCYDASSETSFKPVERLLHEYRALKLPTVVVACKSDLETRVEPRKANLLCRSYDVGIVEVSSSSDAGKEKMRRSFDWLLHAVFKDRRTSFMWVPNQGHVEIVSSYPPGGPRLDDIGQYRNPASPQMLASRAPWEGLRASSVTPTAASASATSQSQPQPQPHPLHKTSSQSRFPHSTLQSTSDASSPTSPTRARSTSDLLSEHERLKNQQRGLEIEKASLRSGVGLGVSPNINKDPPPDDSPEPDEQVDPTEDRDEDLTRDEKDKDLKPAPWATLEQLLDKLLFLAVSGDDPSYISHFLLTYRRFATPRSVLLAMQKRMRQLDEPSADPMFACFAQMRICHLLETWMQDYPGDFAVRGTQGALAALVRSIIGKTHLLHYGSDFLPFIENYPNLVDNDSAWALKVTDHTYESDDSSSNFGEEEDAAMPTDTRQSGSPSRSGPNGKSGTYGRERKYSLPLTAKSLVAGEMMLPSISSNSSDPSDLTPKQILKELQKMAQEVSLLESMVLAEEITRLESKLFLEIEPRDWLQHTLVPGRKEANSDSIARFSQVSSHLADWVVSLILCHDKPKARARQIEKFVDVATALRRLNNYSALRAFVAGINNSTFPDDETMEIFRAKSWPQYKQLQTFDLLLQYIRSHRAYRMALRATKGACIPALEVHVSDLIRTHEGNPDFNPNDPTKIHWGKFNLMGKFIASTTQCQIQCRLSNDYEFQHRPAIQDLLTRECLMTEEMQRSRLSPPSELTGTDDTPSAIMTRGALRDYSHQTKDPSLIRRILFWQ